MSRDGFARGVLDLQSRTLICVVVLASVVVAAAADMAAPSSTVPLATIATALGRYGGFEIAETPEAFVKISQGRGTYVTEWASGTIFQVFPFLTIPCLSRHQFAVYQDAHGLIWWCTAKYFGYLRPDGSVEVMPSRAWEQAVQVPRELREYISRHNFLQKNVVTAANIPMASERDWLTSSGEYTRRGWHVSIRHDTDEVVVLESQTSVTSPATGCAVKAPVSVSLPVRKGEPFAVFPDEARLWWIAGDALGWIDKTGLSQSVVSITDKPAVRGVPDAVAKVLGALQH